MPFFVWWNVGWGVGLTVPLWWRFAGKADPSLPAVAQDDTLLLLRMLEPQILRFAQDDPFPLG